MTPQYLVALALADSMLAGDAGPAGLMRSATWSLGRDFPWLYPLCRVLHRRTKAHFHSFRRHELAELINAHGGFAEACGPESKPLERPVIVRYCLERQTAPEKEAWLTALDLPPLATSADLAAWFKIPLGELAWYADQWRSAATTPEALQHYRYRWLPKRSGGWRLLEMPKLRLRVLQRQILRKLLDAVPPHAAAHGFRRGHSCLTHAALHTGQDVVIRIDLKDFFPSVAASRVQALFRKLGYAEPVAGALARLCTHRTPTRVMTTLFPGHALDGDVGVDAVVDGGRGGGDSGIADAIATRVAPPARAVLRQRHLPQGAPTSPALANLCAYRLDLRLAALAATLGARYSRYADDLAFSGGAALRQAMQRLHVQVAAIALEEGFQVNTRKTRMMPASVCQQLTGIVVNRHPNLPRREFDLLKAILTNCVRHGPLSQNRERRGDFQAYLAGRLSYLAMLNPQRGAKLRAIFERIAWPHGSGGAAVVMGNSGLAN